MSEEIVIPIERGAAHGGEARRKMWKRGRDSGLTATSVINGWFGG